LTIDIIIPYYKGRLFTEQCIESILKNVVGRPYHIILVDDGSFENVRVTYPNFTKISLGNHSGYVKSVNVGLKRCVGDVICLLNNDTIVGKDAIIKLSDFVLSHKDVGLASPMSNQYGYYIHPDKIGDYKPEENYKKMDTLFGFCLVFRRDVYDKIGNFDERFGIGLCEETDYCLKSLDSGYINALYFGAYIYHFGSITLSKLYPNWKSEIYKENWAKLKKKWEGKYSEVFASGGV